MKKRYLTSLLSFTLAFLTLIFACNLPVVASMITDPPGFDDFEGCGIHSYDQAVVASKYLASVVTCSKKATYYYSCYCGAKGTETFEHGGTLPHTYACTVMADEYRVPNPSGDDIEFYYSCYCGAKGTKIFSVKSEDIIYTNPFQEYEGADGDALGTMLGEDFSSYPSSIRPVEKDGDISMKIDVEVVIGENSEYAADLFAYSGYTKMPASKLVSYNASARTVTLTDGTYSLSGIANATTGYYGKFTYDGKSWVLCTGKYAAETQFGDGVNVDKPANIKLPNISYATHGSVYMEASYYIESGSKGINESQITSYTADYNGTPTSGSYMDLYTIDFATGAFSHGGKLAIDQWNTVGVLLNLVNGKATFFLNGVPVKKDIQLKAKLKVDDSNVVVDASNLAFSMWSVAKIKKTGAGTYGGSFYIDDVTVYEESISEQLYAFKPYHNDFETYVAGETLAAGTLFADIPSADVVGMTDGNKYWKVDASKSNHSNKIYNFAVDATKISDIIYEAKYYIPSGTNLQMQTQFYNLFGMKHGLSMSNPWNDVYIIYAKDGAPVICREGETVGYELPTDEFFTVSVAMNLATATYNVYVNNTLAMEDQKIIALDTITYIPSGSVIIGKINTSCADWATGYAYIDDIKIYEGNDDDVDHSHSYGDWEDYDHLQHVCKCNACESVQYEDHVFDENGTCVVCAASRIKFSGATLTLEDNISINYKMKPEQLDGTGYSNPYVVFNFNGKTVTVTDYTIDSNGRYSFKFSDIAPRMMNDVLTATLYATYEGEVVTCQTRSYSVKEYCYNMLSKCKEGGVYANDTEFKTLLVDLLNYGAAAQAYGDYNMENLVTADLTATQKSWATATAPTLSTVQSTSYKTIDNPKVTWKGGGLLLEDAVTMRFRFTSTVAASNLTVKITTDANPTGWTINADQLVAASAGGYYIYFDGLKARQMRETVYVTVYEGSTAVSNTMTYSIESYAYAKQNDANTALTDLLIAMMKYGDSAARRAN